MFASDSSATNPAAAAGGTGVDVSAKKSLIIGAAFSRMPMPAVTLKHSTTHRQPELRGPDRVARPRRWRW